MTSLLLRPPLFVSIRSAARPLRQHAAFFSSTSVVAKAQLPPRPKPPPETEIKESFLKGSGPGGQKINKTSSAVQLKHVPTGVVVKSQATRSRSQNRKIARELLAQRLDDLAHGDQSRSALVGRLKKKKRDSADKKSRRKYKNFDEDKKEGDDGQADGDDGHADGDDGLADGDGPARA